MLQIPGYAMTSVIPLLSAAIFCDPTQHTLYKVSSPQIIQYIKAQNMKLIGAKMLNFALANLR